ncbi:glycosyl transferase [Catellatospora sp. IY07-71]|uniref:glycosyltransferase family 4 protein n=1 Tax=Catellatospora sp. IY07-71 TaxID=2728827 RepID=UPI001BB51708|nr:glycosyltransferase family 4 protein [Catellatospora sp. IY07-71]BCJ74215.1 glycosyl transferase [Catellatospora sp. IY07-71]
MTTGTEWTGSVVLLLASSTGGIGQHVAGLAEGLSRAGCDVTVCGPAATEEHFRFTDRGARFHPVEIPAELHPSDMRAVRTLRQFLAGARPDVVHAHGLRAGLAAALARPTCPLVTTWHNAPLRAGLRGRVHAIVERIVARASAVTLGASADLVTRANAVGAADARLAPVAAPRLRRTRRSRAAVRSGLGIADGVPVVLSVGRLHPQKAYDMLVTVAARWRDMSPMPRVLIAGEGPSYLDLAAQISQLRAPVTLLGHRNDVGDLIAAADLAVVTSVWEARQLFAQEALGGGLPLVATAVGGIPELVGDGAQLIEPNDPDGLDAAVRKLLGDEQARARLAERGTAQAATWPDEPATIAGVRAVYAELAVPARTGRA